MPSILYGANPPITIGIDADMSSVAAEGGEAIYRGASIAVDEINASGGVLGRQLQLEVKDHRGNPGRGVANIEYFAGQKNTVAVLGGVHTPVALKELPTIHQNKLIYLGPWAAGTTIVDNGFSPNYVFRLSVRDEYAGSILMGHAKEKGYANVSLLLERTGWGRSNERSMTLAAEKQGININSIHWFNWQEPSMERQINKIIDSGAEAILLVANAPEGAIIAKNMASISPDKRIPILSHWGIASGAFKKLAGIDVINTVDLFVLQTYSFLAPSNAEKNNALLNAYRENFDPKVNETNIPAAVGVAHAYDLVHLLSLAIKQAGTTDREQVRDALETIDEYQGLIKLYRLPFLPEKHDALDKSDYIISRYHEGYLVPLKKD